MPTLRDPFDPSSPTSAPKQRKDDVGDWLFWVIGLLVLAMMVTSVG